MGTCADGLVCDDGLCCQPGGTPACRTLVLDGGRCPAGGTAKTYYEDLDGDGYGNPKAPKLLCGKPVVDPYVDNNLDCDDSSAEANPKGSEKCDGLDNNCDGTIDEGLTPVKTYFRDEDGDGYGDATMSVVACAAPKGFVESNNDCDPNALTVHPGAPELCNGIDDDCNGLKDDNPVDVGIDCASTGKGECAPGKTACVLGVKVCQSKKTPKPDICDGLDNNCNGTVDEQPDCGGPPSLNASVIGGARDLNRSLTQAELTAGCLRDTPGATAETWSAPKWIGSGGSDHVLFFEPPSGGTWDLSKPGLKLQLSMSWSMVGANTPAWAASSQPVVSVCAGGTFNRYVHGGSLLTGAGGNFAETIPIAGGNSWVLGLGSGADLTKVARIEVLIRPTANAPAPSFTFTVDGGFVP